MIGGYGRVGPDDRRMLEAENVPFVALDTDAELVREHRKAAPRSISATPAAASSSSARARRSARLRGHGRRAARPSAWWRRCASCVRTPACSRVRWMRRGTRRDCSARWRSSRRRWKRACSSAPACSRRSACPTRRWRAWSARRRAGAAGMERISRLGEPAAMAELDGRGAASGLRRHRLLQVLVDLVEEAGGGEPFLVGADQQRQVLGHVAGLDGVDR